MKIFQVATLIALLLNCPMLSVFAAAGDTPSPAGLWQTYDDSDGSLRSIVEIREKDGLLSGIVVKPFPRPGDSEVCTLCEGTLKSHPIVGFPLFNNIKAEGESWGGGKIIDPKNGKSYSLKLQLQDHGNKLKVRGFLGISLLGRTQYWLRTTAEDPKLK